MLQKSNFSSGLLSQLLELAFLILCSTNKKNLLYFVGATDFKCSQNNDVHNETQLECAMADNQNGDCSTSDTTRDDSWSRRLRRVRSSTSGQRRRKRWRGRVDDLDYACEALLDVNKHDRLSPALDMDEDTVVEQQVNFVVQFPFPKTRLLIKKILMIIHASLGLGGKF